MQRPRPPIWRERTRRAEGETAGASPAMTVAAAAAKLAALQAAGVDCVIYFATLPGYPPLAMLPTWETFARQFMPRFR